MRLVGIPVLLSQFTGFVVVDYEFYHISCVLKLITFLCDRNGALLQHVYSFRTQCLSSGNAERCLRHMGSREHSHGFCITHFYSMTRARQPTQIIGDIETDCGTEHNLDQRLLLIRKKSQ